MVDKGGQLAGFVLTPGNGHEPHSPPDLLDRAPTRELIADKAYDTNDTRSLLRAREIAEVIPSRGNRKAPRWCDPGVYGMRHLVENRFAALKEFRGVATRYCKRALMYGGLLNLVSALVALREAILGVLWVAVRRSIAGWQCKAIFSMVSTGPSPRVRHPPSHNSWTSAPQLGSYRLLSQFVGTGEVRRLFCN